MAVNNTEKSFSKMEFPMPIMRQDAFSLDPTECWPTLAEAQVYAQTDPTAYIGQEIVVIVGGVPKRYMINNAAGDLIPSGGVSENDVATDEEVTEMINEVFADESAE